MTLFTYANEVTGSWHNDVPCVFERNHSFLHLRTIAFDVVVIRHKKSVQISIKVIQMEEPASSLPR